jgi:uncharacterized protein (TIGR03067 family)
MNTGTVVLVILSLSAGLRAADDPEKTKGDADAIKGTWQITLAGAGANDDWITFDGKTYVQKHGAEVVEEGEYVLDPAKSPKAIDFLIKKGDAAGKKQLAVYELDGDALKVCTAEPGDEERPKALEAKAGKGVTLFRLKRVKP